MRIVLATAARVLRQLRRDPRTLALLIVVPCVLEALIKWVFEGDQQIFQRVGVPLVGIFPLVSSHVMDEADRCDVIVLMRDGRILASEPRDELLRRTGAEDVESAFLQLVGAV